MQSFIFILVFQISSLASSDTDSCTTLIIRARSLMETARYKEAISVLDSCLGKEQANPIASNLRGCATILQSFINDEKNNMAAVAYFTTALRADSTNSLYLNNRGRAYQSLRDYKNSFSDFSKAVACDSTNVELHGNILRILWIRNQYKAAYIYCDKMIDKFPDNGYAWYVRGQLKRDYLHKYPEGNRDIKKGEELGWRHGSFFMY